MHLIQRYTDQTFNTTHTKGVDRILDGDYMGSAEFENGSIQRSWTHLRQSKKLTFNKVNVALPNKTVTSFWVICEPEMLESTKERLVKLCGNSHHGCKENPRIHDGLSMHEQAFSTSSWLCVDEGLINGRQVTPVFFSVKKATAIRVYMELTQDPHRVPDHRMGDVVYTANSKEPVKIAGILEDDKVVVKFHNKKFHVHQNDAYPIDTYPHSLFWE